MPTIRLVTNDREEPEYHDLVVFRKLVVTPSGPSALLLTSAGVQVLVGPTDSMR